MQFLRFLQKNSKISHLSTGLSPNMGENSRKEATNPYWGVKKSLFLVPK
jgi:hypothetical protein